ncbi:DUF1330 domain-containing protein [Methylocella sp. CPCC 101449]|uniref:DUF1330 domain-containing protein n=1 Tax=Methylocella sp. CPCC 101449 TaxID=2987531 RepID=UPI00289107E6|nr:DUF1330 domain-containing protein [Methylocella sp. CPCC 101449]MDT2021760.1 DUF1330 domain-containing protein [Methylocella sp. CPCC 101449]
MSAFVIGEVEIVRPEGMKGYGPMVAASIEKFGGRYLARGSKPEVLEGGPAHNILIIEFPDMDSARRWYASSDYAAAKTIRLGSSNLRLILVDSFVKPAT